MGKFKAYSIVILCCCLFSTIAISESTLGLAPSEEFELTPSAFLPLVYSSYDPPEASTVVGPDGGSVEVNNPESPLFGVKVEIPSGALDEPTLISVDIPSTAPPIPDNHASGETPIMLQPTGLAFSHPITLTIPANGLSERLFYVYDSSAQVWKPLSTYYHGARFLIEMDHFSVVNWLCRYVAGAILCTSFEPCSTVTYSIDATTNNAPGFSETEIENAIRRAVQTWQDALGSRLTFSEVDSLGANIKFFWSPVGFSYFLDIIFQTEGAAIVDVNLFGDKLVKFNDTGNVTWSADNSVYNPEASIEAIALHEIGHALGLTHYCPDENSQCVSCLTGPVMGPTTDLRYSPCITLQSNDIERANKLYVCGLEEPPCGWSQLASITVDGDPGEWEGLDYDSDPLGDNVGGAAFDILKVYSALGQDSAYFMVETDGKPFTDSGSVELNVDYKPGQHFFHYGDPYADLHINIGGDSLYAWTNEDYGGELEAFPISGYSIARGNVLEVSIPLSELENAYYSNVTFVNMWEPSMGQPGNDPSQICPQ